MSYICNSCNKSYTTKSNLTAHQKCTKSCKSTIEKKTYNCEYCNKTFSTGKNLNYHKNICSIKKEIDEKECEELRLIENRKIIDQELQKQKDELVKSYTDQIHSLTKSYVDQIQSLTISNKILETRLEDTVKSYERQIELLQNNPRITNNTTTTNNTTVNNDKSVIFNAYFTPEFLREGMKDYDKNLVCHGIPGLADYVKRKFLMKDGKLIYVCTDPARQHFKFIYNGVETLDKTATMLVKSIKPAVVSQLRVIHKDLNETEEKLEAISKYDRTERQKTDLDVTKFIITSKLNPLNVEINELETSNKLSLALSRIV
jgi:hypothetical protein